MFSLNFNFFVILLCLSQFFYLILSKNEANGSPKRLLKIFVHDPSLSFSHSQFLGAIADTLQEAGHEVVRLFLFLTYFPLKIIIRNNDYFWIRNKNIITKYIY